MKLWGRKGRASDEGAPSLVVVCLDGQEDLWGKFAHELGPGEDVVGRDEGCSIQIADSQISRRHLSIEFKLEAGGFLLRDLGSANGTRLNDQPLTEPVVLVEGDVIEIGRSRLVFTSRRVDGQVGALDMKRLGEKRIGTMPGELGADRTE